MENDTNIAEMIPQGIFTRIVKHLQIYNLNLLIICLILSTGFLDSVLAQSTNHKAVYGKVDFTDTLREWDGFGFNYVETSQTYDHKEWPQDYGGFSFLDDPEKKEIVEMVFGDDGLRVGIVKMFLDPLHQSAANQPFDHESTTRNMMFFVREGQKLVKSRNESLQIISTLYGPPAFLTKQRVIRGRDLLTQDFELLADYMVDWASYLKTMDLPIRYLSIHNEGESWQRWPDDGAVDGVSEEGHDYNLYWTPDQVAKFLPILRAKLDRSHLQGVGVTNGEPTNWYRLWAWGYANALMNDQAAMESLGLITSHGFFVGGVQKGRWFGPHSNQGQQAIQSSKPKLHVWCTSTAWDLKNDRYSDGKMIRDYTTDAMFIKELHGNIYEAGVNAIITWAGIQTASQWNKPDPNPGTGFRVYDDGTYEVKKGYYYYKQVTRAGQPGTQVVQATIMNSELCLIAFAGDSIKSPDAFVLTNFSDQPYRVLLNIIGSESQLWQGFRTSGTEIYERYDTATSKFPEGENYVDIGQISLTSGFLEYNAPANSVTTFFAQ